MNRDQGRSTNSLHNSYELYFGPRAPRYEIRKDPEPGSPCYDVFKDGVRHQNFTSHYAAQCYVDHAPEKPMTLRGYDAWKTREPQIYDERCDDCGRKMECAEVNLGAHNILWLCEDCLDARSEHYEQDHDEDE